MIEFTAGFFMGMFFLSGAAQLLMWRRDVNEKKLLVKEEINNG